MSIDKDYSDKKIRGGFFRRKRVKAKDNFNLLPPLNILFYPPPDKYQEEGLFF
jgi:hypothetical protein